MSSYQTKDRRRKGSAKRECKINFLPVSNTRNHLEIFESKEIICCGNNPLRKLSSVFFRLELIEKMSAEEKILSLGRRKNHNYLFLMIKTKTNVTKKKKLNKKRIIKKKKRYKPDRQFLRMKVLDWQYLICSVWKGDFFPHVTEIYDMYTYPKTHILTGSISTRLFALAARFGYFLNKTL